MQSNTLTHGRVRERREKREERRERREQRRENREERRENREVECCKVRRRLQVPSTTNLALDPLLGSVLLFVSVQMSEKGSCPHGGVPFFPVLIPDGTDVAVENFRNGNGGGFSNKSVFVHGSVGETGHQCIRHVVQTGVGYLGHRLLHERSARTTGKGRTQDRETSERSE